jgi:hypothetical protein
MAKVGKTNAGKVAAEAPQLKSRGLKNPVPQNYALEVGPPEMALDNDGEGLHGQGASMEGPGPQKSGKGGMPPKSGKRQPGKM